MSAEQYVQAIFDAIQAAEGAGHRVEVVTGRFTGLVVANLWVITEPTDENAPWDWRGYGHE